ncbi:MAG TPA: DUF2782 domain-containing protein [Rhodanobacteraceae bacterium]|nr:DUF2782 domain-containing protein [Rhodanobacteraceae bacterium]
MTRAIAFVLGLFAALPLAVSVQAQVLATAHSAPPPPRSGLPPPDINDKGVQGIPLPSSSIPPSEAPSLRAANGEQAPTVAVKTEPNGDTVEEYRHGGTLYMVRITPKNGLTQTFLVNGGTGKLIRDPRKGPVDPVYYTIYKWGAAPKPAGSGSD